MKHVEYLIIFKNAKPQDIAQYSTWMNESISNNYIPIHKSIIVCWTERTYYHCIIRVRFADEGIQTWIFYWKVGYPKLWNSKLKSINLNSILYYKTSFCCPDFPVLSFQHVDLWCSACTFLQGYHSIRYINISQYHQFHASSRIIRWFHYNTTNPLTSLSSCMHRLDGCLSIKCTSLFDI